MYRLVTMHSVTDRRTDGQTPSDRRQYHVNIRSYCAQWTTIM